ncbi:MAG: tetratricopeptide repeat protein [Bacteroides sp.]|nr:tetratricopeptide repeat protein [Bacteroides sp.]
MTDYQKIIGIAENDPEQAISMLNSLVEAGDADDRMYYIMGRLEWKLGHHAEAINCYRRALELNPESDARHALQIATSVFDFFNPDLLNP